MIVGVWVVLVLNAPSFSWLAVPLSFVALRVLAFPVAAGVLLVMTAVVVVAWTGMQGVLDPTIVVGPTAIATLALVTYRALDRESTARLVLVEELTDTQIELAEAQHQAGVAGEIADRLIVSVATVKAHLSHIYTKLGVDTRAGAVAKAIDLRIIRT